MRTATGFDRQPFGKRGVVIDLQPARDGPRTRKTFRLLLLGAASGAIGLIAVFAASQFHPGVDTVTTLQQAPAIQTAEYSYIPICSGGNRRARKVTCLVDGDTGWEHGVKWRLKSVDTPEISKPEMQQRIQYSNSRA